MKPTTKVTTLGLLAVLAATAFSAPVLADPGSQQKNKNQWRNLGIAGAVIAGYGLLTHNQTATVLGAAGGAYSANRYEQDRHHQSQDNANRQRYYRNYGDGNTNGYGYGRTYGWNPPAGNNNGSYNDGSYNNGSNTDYNTQDYNNGYDNSSANYDNGQQAYARRDNGRHQDWAYKSHHSDRDDNEQDH